MKLKNKLEFKIFLVFCVASLLIPASCSQFRKNQAKAVPGHIASSAAEASSEQDSYSSYSLKMIDDFVRVDDIDKTIVIDLKYATSDNFTHRVVYPVNVCVLRLGTAQKLASANAQFRAMGYRIKIWDAFRPVSVQKIFWSIEPDDRFVANPYNGGSVHNRGCAVDVTLVDTDGNEIEMPTGFDNFTSAAYRNGTAVSAKAKSDLDRLTKVMEANGFLTIDTEWWHFEDSDRDKYGNSDIDLSQFL